MTVDSGEFFRIDNGQLTIIGATDVPVNPAPQSTAQKLPLRGSWQGTALTDEGRYDLKCLETVGEFVETQPHSAARHVGCITCVVEWYHPKYGTPTVAAAICRQPAARPESWYIRIRNSQTRNACHSDRSASGVEGSTTWDNEPPQDKTCHSGRFLDSVSLRSE